jgi:hypothetical protein
MAPQVPRSSTRPGSSNGTPVLSRQAPKMPRLPVPPGCSRRRAESAIQVAPATCPANYRSVTLLGSFRDVPDAGAARFYDRLVMAVHAMCVRGREHLARVGKAHQPTCRIDGMTGQAVVMTLYACGCDARSDGLENAPARLWHRHRDGTHTARWADIPTDSPAPLGWLTRSSVR